MAFTDFFTKLVPSRARNEATLSHPAQWLLDKFGSVNDSGQPVTETTVLTVMAFYRCVTLLAGSIATQPKHLYQRSGGGKQIDSDHPSARLIYSRPNEYQNSYQFHFSLVTQLLLHGNFYGYISRDRFYNPIAIHPIAPWRVQPRLESRRKVFYVDGKNIPPTRSFISLG